MMHRNYLHFAFIYHYALIFAVVVGSSVTSTAQDYTAQRIVTADDATACDDGSINVTIMGDATGVGTDTLDVQEFISVDNRFVAINDLVVTGISNLGMSTISLPAPPLPVGDFSGSADVEQVNFPDGSTNEIVVSADPPVIAGATRYKSTAQNGGDVWSVGDTFEFAYDNFDGDFDVAMWIDASTYNHSSGAGCWGKFGLMARQTLSPGSRHCYLQNHGANRPGSENGTCPLGTQTTGLLGRMELDDVSPAGGGAPDNYFEILPEVDQATGIPTSWHYHEVDGQSFPSGFYEYPYLRLQRIGNVVHAWVSEDPAVETDPTNDALWIEYDDGVDNLVPFTIPPDGLLTDPEDPGSDPVCWFVGFAHSTHGTHGGGIEMVEFEVFNFDGVTCEPSEAAPDTLRIDWLGVQRSDVDAGLSYTLRHDAPATGPFRAATVEFEAHLDDGGPVTEISGEKSSEITQSIDVGDLKMRPMGLTGAGDGSFDGTLYDIEGFGNDIWQAGDNMNLQFMAVDGDFDAKIFISDSHLGTSGGGWGKAGLMARRTCHTDSQYDFVQYNQSDGEGIRFSLRHGQRDGSTTNEKGIVDELMLGAPDDDITGLPNPLADPDHLRLIRTGSQITGYASWDDPENFMTPFNWNMIGARNVEGRPDTLHVGVGLNNWSGANPFTMQYTIDVQPYSPPPVVGVVMDGAVLLEANFDTELNGEAPAGAFIGVRPFGATAPTVQDGRLRMTTDGILNAATATWFKGDELNGILDSGFEVEFDARVTKANLDGGAADLPGDGGMFVVMAGADNFLTTPECEGGEVGGDWAIVEEFETVNTFVGTDNDSGGLGSSSMRDEMDTPGDPYDDIYTSDSSSGKMVWWNCDDFLYDYSVVTGDFDVAIEIVAIFVEANPGNSFNKFGIHVRETADGVTLARDQRFFMANVVTPRDRDPFPSGWTTYRRTLSGADNCDDTVEFETPFTSPKYLRVTRVGNTLTSYYSRPAQEPVDWDPFEAFNGSIDKTIKGPLGDGTLNPYNNCNWFEHRSVTFNDLAQDLHVGALNSVELIDLLQRVEYQVMRPNPGGDVPDPGSTTDLIGHAREMGFGHMDGALTQAGSPAAVPSDTGLRARMEGRPMLAFEIDTARSPDEAGGGPAIEGAGAFVNPDTGMVEGAGEYHVALNVAAISHSRQTNEQFGTDFDDLPDIFNGDAHFRLVYRPNGEFEAFSSAGGGGAAGDPRPGETPILNTYIPPLNLGIGNDANPIVGFVASTFGNGSQTLEFDNLVVRRLGGGGGFKRGDGDASGTLNINDPIFNLIFQFLGGVVPVCKDALDTDDSGTITINDPIISLTFQFLGGVMIPPPGPSVCGPDPTADNQDCEAYPPDKC